MHVADFHNNNILSQTSWSYYWHAKSAMNTAIRVTFAQLGFLSFFGM